MESQPQNLVIRFFGVHGVKQVHGRTVRFVVMHNMFNTDLQVGKGVCVRDGYVRVQDATQRTVQGCATRAVLSWVVDWPWTRP